MHRPLEICIACDSLEQSLANALAAAEGGADRLECCAGMSVGGLTPDVRIIEAVRRAVAGHVAVLAMVRPRGGLFDYDSLELEQMAQSIADLSEAGADGVVIGVVRDGKLDHSAMAGLTSRARSRDLQITMHRAFDALSSPADQISPLAELGVQRILTSGAPWGSATSASDNLETLTDYLERSPDTIEWVIGGGVDHFNAARILDSLKGSYSLHAYSSVLPEDRGLSQDSEPSDQGAPSAQVVNPDLVRQLRSIIEARTPGAH